MVLVKTRGKYDKYNYKLVRGKDTIISRKLTQFEDV